MKSMRDCGEEGGSACGEEGSIWASLPPELWCEILQWVGTKDGLTVASFVCRRWRLLFMSRGLLRFHFTCPALLLHQRSSSSSSTNSTDAASKHLEQSFRALLLKFRRECSALASISFSPNHAPSSSSLSSSSSPAPPSSMGNPWVTDDLVRTCFGGAGGGFRSLTELDLTNCRLVSAASLGCLPPSLLRLNLRGCRNIVARARARAHEPSTSTSASPLFTPSPEALGLPPLVAEYPARDADAPPMVILDFSSVPSSLHAAEPATAEVEAEAEAESVDCGDGRRQSGQRTAGTLPPGLRVLSFAYCWRLSDAMLAPDHLPTVSLRHLSLRDCKSLTETGMYHLSALTGLEVLDLSSCTRAVTDAVLAAVLPALSRLRELNLTQCKEVSAEGLRHLPRSLTALDLVFCKKLLPAALDFMPPGLRHLNLAYCFFLKNKGGAALPFPPALRRLNLTGCEQLTDGALRDVAAAVPRLRHLNLAECYRISDVGLSYLSGCDRLESLDISYCTSISDIGVLSLLPASLHTLTLRNLFENNLFKDGPGVSTAADGAGLKGVQKITHSITAEAIEALSQRINVVVTSRASAQKADYQLTQDV